MSDMTPLHSPGWYPDPAGLPGQKYWDGQAWIVEQTAPPAPVSDGITKTDLKNWATYGLAGYSTAFGLLSLPFTLLCGVGFAFGLPALGMGFIAHRSARPGAPKKLAMIGMISGAVSVVVSVLIWVVLFS